MLIKDCKQISRKIRNHLIREGIETMEQLRAVPTDDIKYIPGIGVKSAEIIIEMLKGGISRTEIKITPGNIYIKNNYDKEE